MSKSTRKNSESCIPMKIQKLLTHEVTFSVEYFEGTEGGMDHWTFGRECGDIGAAIQALQLAKISEPNRDWIIVCNVLSSLEAAK